MNALPPLRRTPSVVTVLTVLAAGLGVFLLAAPPASATTYVSGYISADTTWGLTDTTYVMVDHVTVRSGVTLTILPGVTVLADPGVGLFVEGALYADGIPGNEIQFLANSSVLNIPWMGIQFNTSSIGSVTWSAFERVERAVTAVSSAPMIASNTVRTAGIGFALSDSTSSVTDNTILRATLLGIYLDASSAWVAYNTINGTPIGVQGINGGSPIIEGNTITNITGSFAAGIYLNDVTAFLQDNVIVGVRGSRGPNGLAPGESGQPGGTAIGILVANAPSAQLYWNIVQLVQGGAGGDGRENAAGAGGKGGAGGAGGGIIVSNSPTADVDNNAVLAVTGGRGGNGGGGPTTNAGGSGGAGGGVFGVYVISVATNAWAYQNQVDGLTGGPGGNGGPGSFTDGSGGDGGDAIAVSSWLTMNADVSGSSVQNVRGGMGGNSTTGVGRAVGGAGGDAVGGFSFGARGGNTVFHSNLISGIRGGAAGRGSAGGDGGNATGVLALGSDDGWFNVTGVTSNQIQSITGGAGAMGVRIGGDAGSANGVAMGLATWITWGNFISSLQGGDGGAAQDNSDGGRGGDAFAMYAALVPFGWSGGEFVTSVTRGNPGSGPPVRTAYGTGLYLEGNASLTTSLTIENSTLQSVGDRDIWVNNYAHGTTVATPFNTAKLQVEAAGNLTVRNFLNIETYWPDGFTPVAGVSILVEDEGSPVYNFVSPTGYAQWLLVTDREYINSNTPRDNRTDVTVDYPPYAFTNNPRTVDMSGPATEVFVMWDNFPPTSTASALPPYTNTATFNVDYNASDGSGSGLATITLYYRFNGAGGWIPYATQPAWFSGTFTFVAPDGDGTYEFSTIADDVNGNVEPGPSANETWTILDTARPGSFVSPQPTWRNTLSFGVSWSPDPGVTDIATYDVQYSWNGGAWQTWLAATTQTSATFTAPGDGLYQFRSKATDYAGNVETVPATNDTWTIVDTGRPFSATGQLPVYETTSSFQVQWFPESDDIAEYRIQARDDGGPWYDWIPSTTSLSATFTGAQDGHTYEFRSIATDYAGNVQTTPSGNQSWTIVDMTPPDSAAAGLAQYQTSLLFAVTWGPVSGTVDIATYTLEVSDNGGPWVSVPGAIGVTTTSTSYVGQDGHRYAFRTLATDRAGNIEPAPPANDTWTIVDTTRPSVFTASPRGAGTNTTPVITVTFSERMDPATIQQAFTITPVIDGTFSWSPDGRTLTFTPNRALQPGTTYTVLIDTSMEDVAGNQLVASYPFQFETTADSTIGTGEFPWLWIVIAIAAASIGVTLFLLMRRRSAGAAAASKPAPAVPVAPEDEIAVIDDVFLLYNDGVLIKHETRRLKPDVDTDILSGMLTAVQSFVKDSFRSEEGELDEMTFGQMHILIGRGKWVILAAIVSGDGTQAFTQQIKACIKDIEDHRWDQLEGWNGDMAIAKTLAPYIKKLIRGDYAAPRLAA